LVQSAQAAAIPHSRLSAKRIRSRLVRNFSAPGLRVVAAHDQPGAKPAVTGCATIGQSALPNRLPNHRPRRYYRVQI